MTEIIQNLERIRADYVSDRDLFASQKYSRPLYVERAQAKIDTIDSAIQLLKQEA